VSKVYADITMLLDGFITGPNVRVGIHLSPMLLGGGVRLFEGLDREGIELRKTSAIDTPAAIAFSSSASQQTALESQPAAL